MQHLVSTSHGIIHPSCFCFHQLSLCIHPFLFTGTIFSLTGKTPLHRVPTDYDLPPLPAPRKNIPGDPYKKVDNNSDIPLPVRNRDSREKLKENCDSNKENSVDEQSVDHLVQKGYDRLRVVDALRVARNNLRMAEDILETFVGN